jgi:hypothetical protein
MILNHIYIKIKLLFLYDINKAIALFISLNWVIELLFKDKKVIYDKKYFGHNKRKTCHMIICND